MLRYVTKLTRTPAEMTVEDIEKLKKAGHVDRDILAIVETASYYAFVNRLASGLGVTLEENPSPEGR